MSEQEHRLRPEPSVAPASPVWSWNEWDPLEEVIVGSPVGAAIPRWDHVDHAFHVPGDMPTFWDNQGGPMPPAEVQRADAELAELVRILEAEGVKVRRPDPQIYVGQRHATPDWEWTGSGFNCANPRDVLLVVGDEIIEAPTPRKARRYEVHAYRDLLNEYSRAGARWTSAPMPRLVERSFRPVPEPRPDAPMLLDPGEVQHYPLSELEPLWEAADFMRCGRDIFYLRSYVSNRLGIEWLERHLGAGFRFHEIEVIDRRPVHIDTTFLPLAPGKAMVNPDFVVRLPPVLRTWDILHPPRPVSMPSPSAFQTGSPWLNINVFSLDAERVFVDARQEALHAKLRDWGLSPIAIPFQNYYGFGGGFHCCTLDVRRRGTLESYF